jgi:glutathione S-transferase
MRLYDGGRAPNPRRVRVFLAEKGIAVPTEPVDMGALGHRGPAVSRLNPLQRLPVLELDDGTAIAESIAICRYFEETNPEPPLFGRGPVERALVEMWNRRLELNLLGAVAAVFRHTHPAMKEWEVPQVPEWAAANRDKVADFLRFFDGHLGASRFAAGETYSVADITGLIAVDFMKPAKLAVPEGCDNVRRWHAEVSARPSAAA